MLPISLAGSQPLSPQVSAIPQQERANHYIHVEVEVSMGPSSLRRSAGESGITMIQIRASGSNKNFCRAPPTRIDRIMNHEVPKSCRSQRKSVCSPSPSARVFGRVPLTVAAAVVYFLLIREGVKVAAYLSTLRYDAAVT